MTRTIITTPTSRTVIDIRRRERRINIAGSIVLLALVAALVAAWTVILFGVLQ